MTNFGQCESGNNGHLVREAGRGLHPEPTRTTIPARIKAPGASADRRYEPSLTLENGHSLINMRRRES